MLHHFVGEFGCEHGNGVVGVNREIGLMCQCFKLGNEHIHFSWDEGEVVQFILGTFLCSSILEGGLELICNMSPVSFICVGSSSG
jgi:hypothetical protein